jgi:hypothetical protein
VWLLVRIKQIKTTELQSILSTTKESRRLWPITISFIKEVCTSTGKHYFIEENDEGKFAVRAKGSTRASKLLKTQNKQNNCQEA